jgi:hypothetical protein
MNGLGYKGMDARVLCIENWSVNVGGKSPFATASDSITLELLGLLGRVNDNNENKLQNDFPVIC